MWQPTPVFLPGESPWTEEPGGLQSVGRKESDTTERLSSWQHSIRSMKMHFYSHLKDEETEAWKHETACSKPHGMHISRARNFYPDLDDLKPCFFPLYLFRCQLLNRARAIKCPQGQEWLSLDLSS